MGQTDNGSGKRWEFTRRIVGALHLNKRLSESVDETVSNWNTGEMDVCTINCAIRFCVVICSSLSRFAGDAISSQQHLDVDYIMNRRCNYHK